MSVENQDPILKALKEIQEKQDVTIAKQDDSTMIARKLRVPMVRWQVASLAVWLAQP